MAIDIIICAVVFISAVCYAHIGFARTVISTVQWIVCLVCGILFSDDVKNFIYDIGIGRGLENLIASGLADKAEDSGVVSSTPSLFRDWVGSAADFAAKETAEGLTSVILIVVSFLLIIFSIKIALFVIVHLLSKEYHDGPVAFIDSVSGLILGTALGVVYVFIGLAVLVLVMQLLPESTEEALRAYLDSSYFSGILYDNNPLLMLIKGGLDALPLP